VQVSANRKTPGLIDSPLPGRTGIAAGLRAVSRRKKHYLADTGGAEKEDKARPASPVERRKAETIRLQVALDAANAKIRRLERPRATCC